MIFRKAKTEDTEQIWRIILEAKEQMRRLGSLQWQDGYPWFETITGDIGRGWGYVLCRDDRIAAYGAVMFGGEEAYISIDGAWLSDRPYAVVHRLAVAEEMKHRGVAGRFMGEAGKLALENRVYSFRVDTNFDNHYMHKLLEKQGFTYCGEIIYQDGKRMAYEKLLE